MESLHTTLGPVKNTTVEKQSKRFLLIEKDLRKHRKKAAQTNIIERNAIINKKASFEQLKSCPNRVNKKICKM